MLNCNANRDMFYCKINCGHSLNSSSLSVDILVFVGCDTAHFGRWFLPTFGETWRFFFFTNDVVIFFNKLIHDLRVVCCHQAKHCVVVFEFTGLKKSPSLIDPSDCVP